MKKTICHCDICKEEKNEEEIIVFRVNMTAPARFVSKGIHYMGINKFLDICLDCSEKRKLIKSISESEAKKYEVSNADILYEAIEGIVIESIENNQ